MTYKEFKKLGRSQLIEIIYQLQLQLDKVNEEKQELKSELAERRIRLSDVGNIADAALKINDCFRSAQNAAEMYLKEIKAIREETEAERQRILAQAQEEAKAIIAEAKKTQGDCASEEEFEQNPSDCG